MTGILCCLFYTSTSAQNDQIGKRNLFTTRLCTVEFFLDSLESLLALLPVEPDVDFPILLRCKAIRAPFAPPRLSEPRKVDADAQAVDTSWIQTVLKQVFYLSVQRCHHRQLVYVYDWDRVLPDQFFFRYFRAEVT